MRTIYEVGPDKYDNLLRVWRGNEGFICLVHEDEWDERTEYFFQEELLDELIAALKMMKQK